MAVSLAACTAELNDEQGTASSNAQLEAACTVPEPELCDGLDNDCDGLVDEYITGCETAEIAGPPPAHPGDPALPLPEVMPDDCVDNDGDRAWVCETSDPGDAFDCDDTNALVFPGAPELCDSVDNDCDGTIDEHITGCDTAEIPGPPPAHPGDPAPTAPGTMPEDCTDNDGDLAWACETSDAGEAHDCDDTNDLVFEGAPELCDGIDNDCDGQIDEGITGCDHG